MGTHPSKQKKAASLKPASLSVLESLHALVHLDVIDSILAPLALRVEYALVVSGHSQQCFTTKSGISRTALSHYLTGKQPKGDPSTLDTKALTNLAKVASCAGRGITLPWLAHGTHRPGEWSTTQGRLQWAVRAAARAFDKSSEDSGKYMSETCLHAFPGLFDRNWFVNGVASPPHGIDNVIRSLRSKGCRGHVGDEMHLTFGAKEFTALRRLIDHHPSEVPPEVHEILAQAVAEQRWPKSRDSIERMDDLERRRYFLFGRHQFLGSAEYQMLLPEKRALGRRLVSDVLAAWT